MRFYISRVGKPNWMKFGLWEFLGTFFNMAMSFLFFGDVTSGYLYKPDAVLYFTCGWAALDEIWFVGVFGDALQHGDVIFILR